MHIIQNACLCILFLYLSKNNNLKLSSLLIIESSKLHMKIVFFSNNTMIFKFHFQAFGNLLCNITLVIKTRDCNSTKCSNSSPYSLLQYSCINFYFAIIDWHTLLLDCQQVLFQYTAWRVNISTDTSKIGTIDKWASSLTPQILITMQSPSSLPQPLLWVLFHAVAIAVCSQASSPGLAAQVYDSVPCQLLYMHASITLRGLSQQVLTTAEPQPRECSANQHVSSGHMHALFFHQPSLKKLKSKEFQDGESKALKHWAVLSVGSVQLEDHMPVKLTVVVGNSLAR